MQLPVIRVDDDVYGWLQSMARPFEDTPNSVLRRLSGLGAQKTGEEKEMGASAGAQRTASGKELALQEGLDVRQAFYHKDGTWFQPVTEFPVALFDRYGFVVFTTQSVLEREPRVRVTEKTNVPDGISSFTAYRKMSHPAF